MIAYFRSLTCIGAFLVVAAALAIAPCEAAAAGTSTGHHLLGVQGYKKGHGYGYNKGYYGGSHYNKGYYKKGHGRKLSGSTDAEYVMPEALPAQLSDPLVATDAGVEGRALLTTQATQGYKRSYGRKGPACACPRILAPVCGSDGRTYDNRCVAECRGVRVVTRGSC